MFRSAVDYLTGIKHVSVYIGMLALVASVVFSFIIYPRIAGPHGVLLDPDHHGELALGILKSGTFSYYPDTEPTIGRGPAYPAIMSLLLLLTNEWWPYCVQLAQAFMVGLMCIVIFWMASVLWNRRVAVVASLLCAVHPITVWYTSRIWVETTTMLLLALVLASSLYLSMRPTVWRAVLLGMIIAASVLCKGTFQLYIVLVPALLLFTINHKAKWRMAALVFLVTIVFLSPWTARNWVVAGKFIPVHIRGPFNLWVGDVFAEHYSKAPFSNVVLWDIAMEQMDEVIESLPESSSFHEFELMLDDALLQQSLEKYRDNPFFLVRKSILNAFMFWTLGESPGKSLALSVMLLPLFILFVIASVISIRRGQLRAIQGLHVILILAYYVAHIPMEAIARYSVVLVPSMIMYCTGIYLQPYLSERRKGAAGA